MQSLILFGNSTMILKHLTTMKSLSVLIPWFEQVHQTFDKNRVLYKSDGIKAVDTSC
eukprot:m.203735 g.203735  ORF g.203735 m.203735 type:complete len:57 (+) comp22223_c0_seq1:1114-1284(+)